MRIRLLIPVFAALALSACGERPTPKPEIPSKATAPIAPAQAPEAAPATPAAAVCPPTPAPVCPPVATAKKASVKTAVAHKAKVKKRVHHKTRKAPPPKHYAYKRPPPGYQSPAERRHHGYGEGHHERRYAERDYPPPPPAPTDHFHAYGNSGAVEHFAQRDERAYGERYGDGRRMDDRYSSGGYARSEEGYSYSRREERYEGGARAYEHSRSHDDGYRHDRHQGERYQDERSQGERYRGEQYRGEQYRGGSSYSYSESSRERASSSYSESHGGFARSEAGCCGRTEAAGRDANGFLTWPGKVPAAAY